MYITIKNSIRCIIFILVLIYISGCGRYIPPVTQDVLVPTVVEELTALMSEDGSQRVVITWVAPEKDLRGKKLNSLTGYSVETYSMPTDGSTILSDQKSDKEFEEIKFIEDTYLKLLKEKQKDAESRGDIVRRVSVSKEQRTFQFIEPTKTSGTVLYRVIPQNIEGGEGAVTQLVQVSDTPLGTRTAVVIDAEPVK
jgi:hypothetical protein